MTDKTPDIDQKSQYVIELERKLLEAQSLIYAIRHGEVDALLLNKDGKVDVYSLESIDYTYRVLIEKFAEGALSISEEGLILYCNSYFSELTETPLSKIVGSYLYSYLPSKDIFNTMLKNIKEGVYKGELVLKIGKREIPVYISLTSLQPNLQGYGIIINDLSDKKKSEETILTYQQQLEEKINQLNRHEKNLQQVNKELAFQNKEKEERAGELKIANVELAFQNVEKEDRAAELITANKELAFQMEEKEKRASELIIANKELRAFTYISSHDLQEPLRKIQVFATMILDTEFKNLSPEGKHKFERMNLTALRMQRLIEDLLAFSRVNSTERVFIYTNLSEIVTEVIAELQESLDARNVTIEATELCSTNLIPFQFRQLMFNLISNAIKFARTDVAPHIIITSKILIGKQIILPLKVQTEGVELIEYEKLSPDKNYCHIQIKDNGIGFEPRHSDRIFEVFQRLHNKEAYEGTGIGLAIVKKIIENHNGIIIATSQLMQGVTFDIYLPADN